MELKLCSQDDNWQGGYCSLASTFPPCWICYAETKPHSGDDLFFRSRVRRMTWVHTGNVSEVNAFVDCLSSSEWEEVLKMVGQIKMSMPAGWREGSVAKRINCSCREPGLFPNVDVRGLTATYNSSSRRSKASGLHRHQHSHVHTDTHRHIIENKSKILKTISHAKLVNYNKDTFQGYVYVHTSQTRSHLS